MTAPERDRDPSRSGRCPDGGYCHGRTLAAGSPPCAEGECFRVRTSGPLSGVFPDDRWPVAVLDRNGIKPPERPAPERPAPERPAPERPAPERILIDGEWLVEDVGQHTCGAGGEWPHEPGCGLVPLMPLTELDEQMKARSRFAARVVGPGPIPGSRVVEVYAGARYAYPSGRSDPRVPVGQLLLDEEQATDLLRTLGEPDPLELPERLRPSPQSWPL